MIPQDAKWYTSRVFVLDWSGRFRDWDECIAAADSKTDPPPAPAPLDDWLDAAQARGFVVDTVTPLPGEGPARVLIILRRRMMAA